MFVLTYKLILQCNELHTRINVRFIQSNKMPYNNKQPILIFKFMIFVHAIASGDWENYHFILIIPSINISSVYRTVQYRQTHTMRCQRWPKINPKHMEYSYITFTHRRRHAYALVSRFRWVLAASQLAYGFPFRCAFPLCDCFQ